jgi:hypothetical protein
MMEFAGLRRIWNHCHGSIFTTDDCHLSLAILAKLNSNMIGYSHVSWLKYFNLNYFWNVLKDQINVQSTILAKLFQNTEWAMVGLQSQSKFFQFKINLSRAIFQKIFQKIIKNGLLRMTFRSFELIILFIYTTGKARRWHGTFPYPYWLNIYKQMGTTWTFKCSASFEMLT